MMSRRGTACSVRRVSRPRLSPRLNTTLNSIISDAKVRDRLTTAGVVVRGSSAAEFGQFMAAEYKKWNAVARSRGNCTAITDFVERIMDEKDLHDRGLKLRIEMFGRDTVEKRMNAFGDFGKPLQHIINAYAYGDVWQRPALPPATKSLVMVAMMAAAGHSAELGRPSQGRVEERLHAGANSGSAAPRSHCIAAFPPPTKRTGSLPTRCASIRRASAYPRSNLTGVILLSSRGG